jgi:hypothetical protein
VDFKTQKRTPKLGAQWFREVSRQNAVVEWWISEAADS